MIIAPLDFRTIQMIKEAENRPVCSSCGNKVDMSKSDTEVLYICRCSGNEKQVTFKNIPGYKHPEKVF